MWTAIIIVGVIFCFLIGLLMNFRNHYVKTPKITRKYQEWDDEKDDSI